MSIDDRKSAAEVEHQASDVRADLAHTLNQLRDNLKPEHVVEEVVSNARIGASTIADQLYQTARSHPLPAMLIGLGASMIFGIGARSVSKPRAARIYEPVVAKPLLDRVQRDASRLTAAEIQRHDADPGAFRAAGPLSNRMRDTMIPSTNSPSRRPLRPVEPSRLSGLLDEQPLILAALGIAVGAAIGAVLPTTRLENEWAGGSSSSMRAAAADAARDEIDELSDVAGRTAQNLRRTAADHGVTGDNINGLFRDVGAEAKSAINDIGGPRKPIAQDS